MSGQRKGASGVALGGWRRRVVVGAGWLGRRLQPKVLDGGAAPRRLHRRWERRRRFYERRDRST